MNIGEAARRSGVSAKTIRYYESVGLIPAAGRTSSGYRAYTPNEVETLRFIHRARSLGFSVADVAGLLELWRDRSRASADVKAIALKHVTDIERKISELDTIRRTLLDLTRRCCGDDHPECPILEELAT
jgi:MerR family copper efflux transcriptional regulator